MITKKILNITIVTILIIKPLLLPVLVWAEELTPTPTVEISTTPDHTPTEQTPSPVDSAVTPTADPTPSNSPTPTEAPTIPSPTITPDPTITEAQLSQAPQQTDSCQPSEEQPTCPSTNVSQTDTQTDSTAATGNNEVNGTQEDVSIKSGDAKASGEISNQSNTNSGEANLSAQNDASASATQNIEAKTGENTALGNEDVQIKTGNALAYANLFNLINSNIAGADFVILVLNIDNQNGDIDLNQVWKDILNKSKSPDLTYSPEVNEVNIQVINSAVVENNIDVNAASGANTASYNRSAMVVTGDAIALANVVNIINTNFAGKAFFFGAINIFHDFSGNLILPRPEMFNSGQSNSDVDVNASNSAQTQDQVVTNASTGENQATGNVQGSTIDSGDAQSMANSFSVVNLTVTKDGWFLLVLNSLGEWTGYILGWNSPESQQVANSPTTILSTESSGGPISSQSAEINADITNQATIKDNISVTASTGQNVANDNQYAQIKTGKAIALANLFNLINLNVLGSYWFMGLVNILGNWSGNLIFAYPDTTVQINGPSGDIKPGDEVSYHLIFQNQGYDEAKNVKISFPLPQGLSYISDSTGQPQDDSNLEWNVGNLNARQEGAIDIKVKVNPDLKPKDLLTFWDKIITKAYAAESGERENIVVNVSITTSDPQSNTGNDHASASTSIYFPSSNGSSTDQNGGEKSQTTLELSAKNNVNEFVYPGDTVTFEIVIKNTGGVKAEGVTLSQKMYNSHPQNLGTAEIPIGNIEPGQSITATFGLQLMNNLPAGTYTTEATATGGNTNSNAAVTSFRITSKLNFPQIPEVQAADEQPPSNDQPTVLGVQDTTSVLKPKTEWMPYALATLLGILWLTEFYRRKTLQMKLNRLNKKNNIEASLDIPATKVQSDPSENEKEA